MPRRECSIFACPAPRFRFPGGAFPADPVLLARCLAGKVLPGKVLPGKVPRGLWLAGLLSALLLLLAGCAGAARTSGHEFDNATRFLDFGTAEERACGPSSSGDGPAGCVPDVDGGAGFDPALGTALGEALGPAREAARDALHAREIQRLNDLIPDGGM